MRIKEKIEKAGSFWLPGKEENKVPGEISIVDGGKVTLTVLSNLGSVAGSIADIRVGRVLGNVEGFGCVTLEGCFYTTLRLAFGNSQSKSVLSVGRLFAGVAYGDDVIKSSMLSFSVEGLDEWVGVTGIKVARDDETFRVVSISYEPVPTISVRLSEGIELKIIFSWTTPGFPIQREAKITQKVRMELHSNSEVSVTDLTAMAYKVVTFLCMGTDAIVSIEDPTIFYVESEDFEGEPRKHAVKLFYSSLPYSPAIPNVTWHELIFNYRQLNGSLESKLQRWIGCFEKVDPSINLYFSVKMGDYRYLDAKFLALAQALESLHRRTRKGVVQPKAQFKVMKQKIVGSCPEEYREWLASKLVYANEFSLAHRLKELISIFSSVFDVQDNREGVENLGVKSNDEKSDSENIELFVRTIVDTRNYYTHFDESGKRSIARGAQLASLVNRMELLMQLHLLFEMGFEVSELSSMVKSNFKMGQKLSRGFEQAWVSMT